MKSARFAVILLTGTAAIAGTPAYAQQSAASSDGDDLDQIIVSAQKRDENIVDVPVSVSVVTAEQLDRQQVNSIQDLERTSPLVAFTEGGEGSPGGGAVVRGIGTQAFSRSASSSVGIVVDGVPTGNVNITNLFDLERVEVLAGPQGTLFGDSVSAGLINVVTQRPRIGEFSGRASVEFAPKTDDLGQERIRGVVNIPLGDLMALRTSGYYNHVSGPGYNVFRDVEQAQEEYGFRSRLLFEPSPNISLDIIADYNKVRSDEFFNAYVAAEPGSPLPGQLLACGVVIGPDNTDTCGSDPTYALTENWGVSGTLNFAVGDHTITSITAYRDQDTEVLVDVDGLPARTSVLQILSGPERHPASFFTQELRLTSPAGGFFEYVIGAFYSKYDSFHSQPSAVQISFPFLPFPINSNSRQTTDTLKKDYAIFGQATLNFTDQLSGIVGLRHNWSSIDDVFTQGGVVRPLSEDVTNFSFKLGLAYDFALDSNVYATVTRGYKGPQANNIDTTAPPVLVLPEEPMYYEVGAKAGLFDGRLIASLALYYADIDGYQAQYCQQVDVNNPTPVCAPNNVDGVTTKGFDLLFLGSPFDGLSINAGVAYAKATYPDGYLSPDGTDLGGRQLANAPRWRATFSGEYSADLSNTVEGFVSLGIEYQSERGLNLSANENQVVPERTIVGGRLGARINDRLTVALYGRNLFDTSVPIGAGAGVAFGNAPIFEPGNSWRRYSPNSGRIFGISADVEF